MLSLQSGPLGPATPAGPWRDAGNGLYAIDLIAPTPGSAQVVVEVEGLVLADQPLVTFTTP